MKTYEAMFLLDAGQPNFDQACEPIKKLLDRYGAEVIAMKLWDERKLCYEIQKRKRGLYVLCYFKMDAANVVELENDVHLGEEILRVMILRRDDLTEEEINAETPAQIASSTPGKMDSRNKDNDGDDNDADESDEDDSDDNDEDEESDEDDDSDDSKKDDDTDED